MRIRTKHSVADDLKARMQNMKDDFRKNFVDINFYGMQSKVPNPMSNPDWRHSFQKQMAERDKSILELEKSKKQLKLQKVENMLPPPLSEGLSPE